MSRIATQHPTVRTVPSVGQQSDASGVLLTGNEINVSFAIDVGQANNMDPDLAAGIPWPDPTSTQAFFHAGHLFTLALVFSVGTILVQLKGGVVNGARSELYAEWAPSSDVPLLVQDYPLPFSFNILRIANNGSGNVTGLFWQYHVH